MKPRIYCDMDGVLCDFAKGVEKVIGKSITQWSYGSKSEKWDKIKSTYMILTCFQRIATHHTTKTPGDWKPQKLLIFP